MEGHIFAKLMVTYHNYTRDTTCKREVLHKVKWKLIPVHDVAYNFFVLRRMEV